MKSERKQKIVSSICMILVICFVIGTATYAWFTKSNRAAANGLQLSSDATGELTVEIAVENGERMEMNRVDENNAVIDMGLTKLANIENNKLGPGALGEVHFFITSDATSFDSYVISVTPNYTIVGGNANEVVKLAKEHIKFYSVKTDTSYDGEIPYREAEDPRVQKAGRQDHRSTEQYRMQYKARKALFSILYGRLYRRESKEEAYPPQPLHCRPAACGKGQTDRGAHCPLLRELPGSDRHG